MKRHKLMPVVITGGHTINKQPNSYNVPREILLGNLENLTKERTLRVSKHLPLAIDFFRELARAAHHHDAFGAADYPTRTVHPARRYGVLGRPGGLRRLRLQSGQRPLAFQAHHRRRGLFPLLTPCFSVQRPSLPAPPAVHWNRKVRQRRRSYGSASASKRDPHLGC